jgi:chromate transporter
VLTTLLHLALVFARCSALAVGGGLSVLPEMQRLSVSQYHWVTNAQFRDSYSLGQITPGPGMLMSAAIGYHAAGLPGALTAGLAMCLPSFVLTALVGSNWNRFAASPWRTSLQRGLAPVVIGLMAAGAYALARTAIVGPITAVLAVAVIVLLFRTRLHPTLLVAAGGALGWLLLR